MLYNADCLDVMREMPDSFVDMIYLDPPFCTQKKQSLSDSDGHTYEFSDVWYSQNKYLDYMHLRIAEMKRLLKSSGCIFLHCSVSISHYMRMIMDDIFGTDNFRSEIIWTYKRWSNSSKNLLPGHQVILYYSKTDTYKFNVVYTDYSVTTNIDQILQERERSLSGKVIYKRDERGGIVQAKEKQGVPLSDVWYIPFLNPKARERTGYPTQKPIELLERIIKISTNEDDYVLDPFCGSGTTLAAAKLLNRKFIGIDTNPEAIRLTSERLISPYKTKYSKLTIEKTRTQEELSILKQLDCNIVQRNKGIDAFLKKHYGGHPVAVRVQRENESFSEAARLLKEACKNKNCSFLLLITHEKDWESLNCRLPENMIVIEKYMAQFEAAIEEFLRERKQS